MEKADADIFLRRIRSGGLTSGDTLGVAHVRRFAVLPGLAGVGPGSKFGRFDDDVQFTESLFCAFLDGSLAFIDSPQERLASILRFCTLTARLFLSILVQSGSMRRILVLCIFRSLPFLLAESHTCLVATSAGEPP